MLFTSYKSAYFTIWAVQGVSISTSAFVVGVMIGKRGGWIVSGYFLSLDIGCLIFVLHKPFYKNGNVFVLFYSVYLQMPVVLNRTPVQVRCHRTQ